MKCLASWVAGSKVDDETDESRRTVLVAAGSISPPRSTSSSPMGVQDPPILSVFGRVLLMGDFSGQGGFFDLAGVRGNARTTIFVVVEPDISEGLCLSCENLQSMKLRGYANWEESCLVKFSEFWDSKLLDMKKS